MCDGPGQPASVTEALAMLDRALDHLAAADAASLPGDIQAEALRALERAQSKHTVARARILAAFASQATFEDDGHGSARTWLKWQARVTTGAAAGAVGWMRRLSAHPVIAGGLAAGDLSESWARQLCEWTGRLPETRRDDADEILLGAARAGADLAGLAGLAREICERSLQEVGDDPDGRFADRALWLGVTFGGAGRLTGDLTPGCSAALSAVLDALAKRAGPEDIRTAAQRRHDALEEAARRLIAAGMLPGRAGQPAQIQVHMTLSQLRGTSAASPAESAWMAARTSQFGWLTGPEADAAACDATIVPVVTGHVDGDALDRLTDVYLAPSGPDPNWCRAPNPACASDFTHDTDPGYAPDPGDPEPGHAPGPTRGPAGNPDSGRAPELTRAGEPGGGRDLGWGPDSSEARAAWPLSPATRQRLSRALLGLAADALSGPGGLAARLRATLDGKPLTSASLPLDIGAATETIPAHLRRAVTIRHRTCAFPGCDQPASVCEVHHIIPRSRGGPTALPNLVPLCRFHHLTVIHRWGWRLVLHADGSTAAISPEGRTVRSHGPPSQAA